jgi:hypothetical protein
MELLVADEISRSFFERLATTTNRSFALRSSIITRIFARERLINTGRTERRDGGEATKPRPLLPEWKGRDPPRLVAREQFGRRSPARLILEIDVRNLLSVVVTHDVAGRLFLDCPRRRDMDFCDAPMIRKNVTDGEKKTSPQNLPHPRR